MTKGQDVTAKLPKGAIATMALLFFAAVINYVDRGSLSIAGHAISVDFKIDKVQLGFLLSSFFMTYAVFQLFAGWLVDRFSVIRVFAAGFGIWAFATILSGFAHSYNELFACRLLLGIGEAAAYPCFAKIIVETFAISQRGLPNALIEAGTKLGPVVGMLAGGFLLGDFGWRNMFIIFGALSLLWLVPWFLFGPRVDGSAATQSSDFDAGPSFWDILQCRDAWGTFLGGACYLYSFYFLLTWLPTYLIEVRHLSAKELGVLGSIPPIGAAVATITAGIVSDGWISNGMSTTRARKTMVGGGLLMTMTALPAAYAHSVTQCIALLSIAYIAFGVFASNHWAMAQTLAGKGAGKWAGLQKSMGAGMGVIAPIITGYIVRDTGSYLIAFGFTAVLAVLGAGFYVIMVGEVKPVDWAARKALKG